ARRRGEVAPAVAEHYPHTFASRCHHIKPAVTIDVREFYLKGAVAKIERRFGSFGKIAGPIAEQHSQLALVVMGGDHIGFVVALTSPMSADQGWPVRMGSSLR